MAFFSWEVLGNIFGFSPTKRLAPIYYFLTPWSRGSLRKRSHLEDQLVHFQQRRGEGISLIDPPAAWISSIDQIPEEASHLFALIYQRSSKRSKEAFLTGRSKTLLETMILHEAFAKFGELLILNARQHSTNQISTTKQTKTIWESAHRQGYALGTKLAKKYFEERCDDRKLRKWFSLDWFDETQSRIALRILQNLIR